MKLDHSIRHFFLICFWVFTVFTSTQDTSQISTCINLHYTTLLHKENTTTLDYENKRKERKKEKLDMKVSVAENTLLVILRNDKEQNIINCV